MGSDIEALGIILTTVSASEWLILFLIPNFKKMNSKKYYIYTALC